jgi:hypothetical protein
VEREMERKEDRRKRERERKKKAYPSKEIFRCSILGNEPGNTSKH